MPHIGEELPGRDAWAVSPSGDRWSRPEGAPKGVLEGNNLVLKWFKIPWVVLRWRARCCPTGGGAAGCFPHPHRAPSPHPEPTTSAQNPPNRRGGRVPPRPPGARRRCAVLVLADAPRDPSFVSLVEPWGGRQAELLCTVDSHPPADITLLRGRAPLASTRGPSDPRASVQAEPNTLRVRMVALGPGDAGLYVCSANNSFGTASTSLLLAASGEHRAAGGFVPHGGRPREPRATPPARPFPPAQVSESRWSPLQKSPKVPRPP